MPSSLRPAGIAETGNQLPHLLFGFDMVRLLEDLLFFSLGQGFKRFMAASFCASAMPKPRGSSINITVDSMPGRGGVMHLLCSGAHWPRLKQQHRFPLNDLEKWLAEVQIKGQIDNQGARWRAEGQRPADVLLHKRAIQRIDTQI